jgi:DNA-binding CsgD family transcriptional regulator
MLDRKWTGFPCGSRGAEDAAPAPASTAMKRVRAAANPANLDMPRYFAAAALAAIRRSSYLQLIVSSVANLGAGDLEGVLGVVAEAAAADGATPFERPLIDRLAQLVPADHAGYYEYGCEGRSVYFVETPTMPCGLNVEEHTSQVWKLLPYWPLHDERLFGIQTAVKFSDFVSAREKRSNPWYMEVMRCLSQEHECKLLLPNPNGNVRGFFFVRESGRKDFDERDRAVLTVLRSQLVAIRDRWERQRRPPGLTTREAEIAHLLREGLTNQEIADRLVISTGTVRTHLENMFAKLDVHTRTAAVARALGQTPSHER